MVQNGVDASGDVIGYSRDVVQNGERLDCERVTGVGVDGHKTLGLVGGEAQEEGDDDGHCGGRERGGFS